MSDTDLQATVRFVTEYFRLHPETDVAEAEREIARNCVRGLSRGQIENIRFSVTSAQTPPTTDHGSAWEGAVPAFIRRKNGEVQPLPRLLAETHRNGTVTVQPEGEPPDDLPTPPAETARGETVSKQQKDVVAEKEAYLLEYTEKHPDTTKDQVQQALMSKFGSGIYVPRIHAAIRRAREKAGLPVEAPRPTARKATQAPARTKAVKPGMLSAEIVHFARVLRTSGVQRIVMELSPDGRGVTYTIDRAIGDDSLRT